MTRYSIEPSTIKYIIGYRFLSSARNLSNQYRKHLLDTAIKTDFKILFHKTAEATGEVFGNKIADEIVKPKPVSDDNSRNVEEIVIKQEKRQQILNELRQV